MSRPTELFAFQEWESTPVGPQHRFWHGHTRERELPRLYQIEASEYAQVQAWATERGNAQLALRSPRDSGPFFNECNGCWRIRLAMVRRYRREA